MEHLLITIAIQVQVVHIHQAEALHSTASPPKLLAAPSEVVELSHDKETDTWQTASTTET
jgi:hypothetical protein